MIRFLFFVPIGTLFVSTINIFSETNEWERKQEYTQSKDSWNLLKCYPIKLPPSECPIVIHTKPNDNHPSSSSTTWTRCTQTKLSVRWLFPLVVVRHWSKSWMVVALRSKFPLIVVVPLVFSQYNFCEYMGHINNANVLHVHSGETKYFRTTNLTIKLFVEMCQTVREHVIIFTTYHSLHCKSLESL